MKTDIQTFITKTPIVCFLAGICCLLWGSAFPCIKIGYNLFSIDGGDTASQILFAGFRFTLAGVLVLLFALIQTRNSSEKLLPTSGNTWLHILILCIFQTVLQYFFFYVGLAHTSGVKASIVEATNVFIAILVASVIFHQEKLTLPKITGCAIGFCGVVLINLGGNSLSLSFHLNGEGFIFISTFAYALSTVIMKNFSQKNNPVLLSGWQFLLGGIILTVIGLLTGGNVHVNSPAQFAMLLYMAFISAGAYTIWGILMKYNPVSKVSVYGFMNPVFGVILSFLLLNDSSQVFGVQSLFALVLVCLGIYVVNR